MCVSYNRGSPALTGEVKMDHLSPEEVIFYLKNVQHNSQYRETNT